MEHLEWQSAEIQDTVHYSVDNCNFDRVSGVDEEVMLIISNDIQHIMNVHSDTNTNDEIASEKAQTKDHKQINSDTLPHSRQGLMLYGPQMKIQQADSMIQNIMALVDKTTMRKMIHVG